MITKIADLSNSFSHDEIDMKTHVDINKRGEIIGFDVSALMGLPACSMCTGRVKPLKKMTADSWTTMRFSKV